MEGLQINNPDEQLWLILQTFCHFIVFCFQMVERWVWISDLFSLNFICTVVEPWIIYVWIVVFPHYVVETLIWIWGPTVWDPKMSVVWEPLKLSIHAHITHDKKFNIYACVFRIALHFFKSFPWLVNRNIWVKIVKLSKYCKGQNALFCHVWWDICRLKHEIFYLLSKFMRNVIFQFFDH